MGVPFGSPTSPPKIQTHAYCVWFPKVVPFENSSYSLGSLACKLPRSPSACFSWHTTGNRPPFLRTGSPPRVRVPLSKWLAPASSLSGVEPRRAACGAHYQEGEAGRGPKVGVCLCNGVNSPKAHRMQNLSPPKFMRRSLLHDRSACIMLSTNLQSMSMCFCWSHPCPSLTASVRHNQEGSSAHRPLPSFHREVRQHLKHLMTPSSRRSGILPTFLLHHKKFCPDYYWRQVSTYANLIPHASATGQQANRVGYTSGQSSSTSPAPAA